MQVLVGVNCHSVTALAQNLYFICGLKVSVLDGYLTLSNLHLKSKKLHINSKFRYIHCYCEASALLQGKWNQFADSRCLLHILMWGQDGADGGLIQGPSTRSALARP
jgi:hypothetical protein